MIPGAPFGMLGEVAAAGGATDADATTFLTAASITDPTQSSAVHALVIALKTAGIWSKMGAIYPFVGGTATAHKKNLKNPSVSELSGVVDSSTNNANGITMNHNSFINTNHDLSQYAAGNMSASFYSKTSGANNGNPEWRSSGTARSNIVIGSSGTLLPRIQVDGTTSTSITSELGLFIANRVSTSEVRSFANGTVRALSATGATQETSGTVGLFMSSGRICAFAHMGQGLTDTEMGDLNTAVQAFQTTLGRQV